MNADTVTALLELNRSFYARNAEGFSASRQRPWPGWSRVLEQVRASRSNRPGGDQDARRGDLLEVLDAGCGNGRLGTFLHRNWHGRLHYLGLDSCTALLKVAADSLAGCCQELLLQPADLVRSDLTRTLKGRRFGLVAAFGLLHHLPGAATRADLVRRLAETLAPAGVLAVSLWSPTSAARIQRLTVPWPGSAAPNQPTDKQLPPDLEPGQLETGDTLLSWNGRRDPPRFCHFVDAAEVEALVAAVDLPLADRFRADGRSGADNLYLVFQQPAGET